MTSTTPFPVNIIAMVMLLVWIYPGIYLAAKVKGNPWVPKPYRSMFQVISLLAGPAVFLLLTLMKKKQCEEEHGLVLGFIFGMYDKIIGLQMQELELDSGPALPLQLYDSTGKALSEIYGSGGNAAEGREVLNMALQIIDDALRQRASDILIDPQDRDSYAVRFRIDGALRTAQMMPMITSKAVINIVKAVSNMDIAERRRPQDGAFTAGTNGSTISFRVASAGALNGEKLSIRVLNRNIGSIKLADIGLPEGKFAAINEAIKRPAGMIMVCGPTGSGKTTTLYSMLNQIDNMTRNVITVEDPIEAHLPGVSQLEINAKADITFAKALRSMLRQDPDVICVGEIRDEETASMALRAAQTGHLVLATIHSESNATALVRLLDLGVSPELMASGLSLLISQRLVRKLCDSCKEPGAFSPAMTQSLQQRGINPSRIFQPRGCEVCGGSGYFGRMAVCDLLSIDSDLRVEIAQGGAVSAKLRSEGEKKDRANMRNEAFRAALAGVTSLDEIKRVLG